MPNVTVSFKSSPTSIKVCPLLILDDVLKKGEDKTFIRGRLLSKLVGLLYTQKDDKKKSSGYGLKIRAGR